MKILYGVWQYAPRTGVLPYAPTNTMDKLKIIILAGGLGKRMNNPDLPKVLISLKGRPLISYLLEAVKKSGVCARPLIVVGAKAEMVKEAVGPECDYVLQPEQLGTGHAVMCAEPTLKNQAEDIMVLYGDQPLLRPGTIAELARTHLSSGKVLTMGTVTVADFNDWRGGFYDFGRVIRDDSGTVCSIVEKKDATASQLDIKELNPSYFCFKAAWLWPNLKELKNDNRQKEYYLTDLAAVACRQGPIIETVPVDPREAVGVNTDEQLKLVEQLISDENL